MKLLWLLIPSIAFGGSIYDRADPKWAADPFWDQGKAEISIYQVKEMREGSLRPGEAIFVVVKEDHLPRLNVKADNWKQPGLVPRLKFNQVLTIPTGMYTYHQMMSVYFDRADLHPRKATFTSQEWCGQTYKELRLEDTRALLDFSSYWDGEGKGQKEIRIPPGTVPYNALPVFLRALPLEEKGEYKLTLLSDLVSNKVGKPGTSTVTIKIRGKGKDGLAVDVGRDRFWFSAEPLHPLLRWEKSDGSVYELRKRIVDDYWNHSRPGDEKQLQ